MSNNCNSKNKIRNGGKYVRIVLICCLMVSVLISLYPFIYMAFISLMETTTMKLSIDRILTTDYTLGNYISLFNNADYLRYIKNSAIISVYAVAMTCIVSAMAAYAFAKKQFRGRSFLFVVYLSTMMIPTQVTLIPCFLILKQLNMLSTYSAMVLPTCGAFGTLLIHQFLKKLPNDLLEAAEIDGCGEVFKFVRIVLPLIKPVIISLAIFTFINVWGSLVLPLIVNTDAKMTPLTVAIASMKTAMTATNYGYMMAASVIAFLPPFVLYLFLQKKFIEGIALSGIKM